MSYCEDYPACGHTPLDPCARQWYDEPDAFDTTVNPHALCDHENGDCDVDDYGDGEYDEGWAEDDDELTEDELEERASADANGAYESWVYSHQEHNPYGPDEDGLRESDFI